MSMRLYQISQANWPPERYRVEIWENERWSWPVGRKVAGGETPQPGDTVVFFYAPTGGVDPGFYGWAVILEWLEEGTLYFRPVAPSDSLKMAPWWDDRAKSLAAQIRGKVKQATLWRIPGEFVSVIREGIISRVGGATAARVQVRRGPLTTR